MPRSAMVILLASQFLLTTLVDTESAAQSSGSQNRVGVLVTLSDQAKINDITDRVRSKRRAKILKRMRQHANRTQAHLLRVLDGIGATEVKELWILNGVAAQVPLDKIDQLLRVPGLESVRVDEEVSAPVTTAGTEAPAEWNIDMVGAPVLWDLGFRGQGVTVANMDTGVDLQHPDLNSRYRGGSNSWFDPNGEHATPADLDGHGTHTMGLMVGGDAGGTSIGMAFDAQWMAVKIFSDSGPATLSNIHAGFQWLLDPDGNPDTDDSPDIVNNSWGFASNFGQCDQEFQPDIETLKAAGIAVVFSAGNNGAFGSSSDESPANNTPGFAAGSVDQAGNVSGFSSRGPSSCDGTIYPELTAPGENVLTADRSFGGFLFYSPVDGTSFAAPHIAGAMALLKSAFPIASVNELENALILSASDKGQPGEDNDYGYGLIDTEAAYNYLVANPPVGDEPPPPVDNDQDGYAEDVDCNDNDPSINPGAPETKHDGIDQDCNGYDLTIEIIRIRYNAKKDRLRVVATSALGKEAQLQLDGFGPMKWKKGRGQWVLTVRRAGGNPGTITVSGVEGSVSEDRTSPPVAVNDDFLAPRHRTGPIGAGKNTCLPVFFNLLANDTGADLRVKIVDGPSNGGTLTDLGGGSFEYIGPLFFRGTETFTYRAMDTVRGLSSNLATVAVDLVGQRNFKTQLGIPDVTGPCTGPPPEQPLP